MLGDAIYYTKVIMLAQKNRFHGHASLNYVYRNGAVSRSRLFTVRATPNARRTQPRCSVVVSKKVLKSAVGRNRIRRRVYHILHAHLAEFTKPYDVVVMVCTAEVVTATSTELTKQLTLQLKEVQVLAPKE